EPANIPNRTGIENDGSRVHIGLNRESFRSGFKLMGKASHISIRDYTLIGLLLLTSAISLQQTTTAQTNQTNQTNNAQKDDSKNEREKSLAAVSLADIPTPVYA